MITKTTRTPFTDPAAVEVWDAWFRWRDQGRLHDLTIEATWYRVARGLAWTLPPGERAEAIARHQRSLCAWEILPDERIVSSAGTSRPNWPAENLAAVVNIAAFVRGQGPGAVLDLVAIRRAAGEALVMLDQASRLITPGENLPQRHRLGLIGLGDALALAHMSYGSEQALECAGAVAQALLTGAVEASVGLARRYGRLLSVGVGEGLPWMRWLPRSVIEDVHRYGLRHLTLTCLEPHPRLAMLANGVADGVAPAHAQERRLIVDAQHRERRVFSPGYARALLQQQGIVLQAQPRETEAMAMIATARTMQPLRDGAQLASGEIGTSYA